LLHLLPKCLMSLKIHEPTTVKKENWTVVCISYFILLYLCRSLWWKGASR
jgi:hypothetical protein